MIDNCAPRRSRKRWYRKRRSRRNVKRWFLHPGHQIRRKLPLWMPLSKRRGKIKSWQKGFLLFAVCVDLLAKIVQWILDLLKKRDKRSKPLIPIPIPVPKPMGGSPGGKGRTSGPSKSTTCADSCGCLACDEICRPWFCARYCAEDAGYYNQECRCPNPAIDLDDE